MNTQLSSCRRAPHSDGKSIYHKPSVPEQSDDQYNRAPAEDLLEDKLSQCRECLARIGAPKNRLSPNTTDIDYMVRAVMRNPSKEAIQALLTLHEALKSKFLNESDEAINWLLGGCTLTARGGFKDAASVKKFLASPTESIPPSRLITGLETLIAAITYRLYMDKRGVPPLLPETKMQKTICRYFATMFPAYRIPKISDSYPNCKESFVRMPETPQNTDQYVGSYPRKDLSEGSGSEDGSLPPIKFDTYFFERKVGQDRTWIAAANEGNIPIRLGVSASAATFLCTIEWLLDKPPGDLDQKTAELITGVLIIPTFIRGDYHSLAEVPPGLQHFLAHRQKKDPSSTALTPYHAFEQGLSLLSSAIHPDFQEILREISAHILKSAKFVEYPYKEGERSELAAHLDKGRVPSPSIP